VNAEGRSVPPPALATPSVYAPASMFDQVRLLTLDFL
jgi:hypothetical protein